MRFLLFFLALSLTVCDPRQLIPFEHTNELVVLTKPPSPEEMQEEIGGTAGFDRDLMHMLAQELGKKIRFIAAANDAALLERLRNGEATLAAAWQSPTGEPQVVASLPYFEDQDVLVTPDASLPPNTLEQLTQRKLHVVAGSRQESVLHQMANEHPGLHAIAIPDVSEIDLVAGVAQGRFEAAVVSDTEFDIGSNFYPELQKSMKIGPPRPIVWLFAPGTDAQLIARCNTFLERIKASGELARLKDRYFGHIDRLTPSDTVHFIQRMQNVLPLYRPLFQNAQLRTGIDWRLLAALAYQESRWDPLATSPTNVRGMMMLTEETADELGVSNRLNPEQSINAGAHYLNDLRNALPPQVTEPDRLWMALAAYNLGMGHLRAARYIAETLNINPDSWYAMKKVLPLLAQPRYYKRLKSGKGRGGEAVIMVENIRVYADILNRHEPPLRPLDMIPGVPGLPGGTQRLPVAKH